MKNPLKYWKLFALVGSMNALVFVGYKLTKKYKQMNKLNEKDEAVILNTKGKKEKNDEKGKE